MMRTSSVGRRSVAEISGERPAAILKIGLRQAVICLMTLIVSGGVQAGKSAKGAKPATAFSEEPFDLSAEQLSAAQARGHNAQAIYFAIKRAPRKGEYETSAEFEERLAAWKGKAIYGAVRPDSLIALKAFASPLYSKSYDADSGTMTFALNSAETDADGYPFLPFASESKKLPPGRGKTAMGVSVRWTNEFLVELGTRFGQLSGKVLTLQIAPDKARNLYPELLLIGRIDPVSTFKARYNHEPTLTEPWAYTQISSGWLLEVEQVWVLQAFTREVVGKLCYTPHRFEKCNVDATAGAADATERASPPTW